MIDREYVRRKFQDLHQLRQDVRYTESWKGTTGRFDNDPTPQANLPGTMIWVRPTGGRNAIAVPNVVVQQATGIPVIVAKTIDTDDQLIIDLDLPEALRRYGAATVLLYAQGSRLIEAQRFRPGLVLPHAELGGLWVLVEGFWHAGKWLEAQPLELVPTSTSSKQAFVVISHEAGAEALTQELTDDADLAATLTRHDLEALIQSDLSRKWLAAVPVANGATTLDPAKIIDLRFFNETASAGGSFQPQRSSSASDLSTTSTSLTAIDSSNMGFTQHGGYNLAVGEMVECILTGQVYTNSGSPYLSIDIEVDQPVSGNVYVGGGAGGAAWIDRLNTDRHERTIVITFVATEAGVHAFRPVWKVSTSDGHIDGSNTPTVFTTKLLG